MQAIPVFFSQLVATKEPCYDKPTRSAVVLSRLQGLRDMLLPVTDAHLYAELLVDMLSQMLG